MAVSPDRIALVRGFNRFYTKQIGVLRERLLKSPYSLTQARVLYELGTQPGIRWMDLVAGLDLDPGYLSRLLSRFERLGLVKRTSSKDDGRVKNLRLTALGRRAFKELDRRASAEAREVLAHLSEPQQQRLTLSMTAIRELVAPSAPVSPAFEIRTHRPGDIGWVVARHGELYSTEYAWDNSFEGLVAQIAGRFLMHFDEQRERCWIAERAGERLGCIFLVKQSTRIAKLRLLLVEPAARGLGVGTRLVDECIQFARSAGYRKLTLWTNDILHAARRIYERAGFVLAKEERHHSFGHDLTGQFWELTL